MSATKTRLLALLGAGALALAASLTSHFEGRVDHTYRDPVGILTSCVGHTGPELRMGQTFSAAQCDAQLYADLLKHADALNCIKRPLSDGQKAAFLSFAFNVGNARFCDSGIVRKANAGDLPGACAELGRWVYAGGRQLPGLVQRRAAERAACEGRPIPTLTNRSHPDGQHP
ncbi:lysozyme [Andreprevotia lacus DSM 23236]|jgi:lysozyme|uniref:Lysozyme n=1 Tax=Andreprevotia lacus DSM 23236 TaxID=1121001 RepID=A0A1W1XTA9_9NEIS|nr:lysozyme [Andreprevotia lacus]SMC27199.1 lysozyme [Andreprevotia lacus DSM 23236]